MGESTSRAPVNWRDLDDALPQTQCTRCGHPDCERYARAMADGTATILQCPPGGQEGVQRLAALTGQAPAPLNPTHGVEGPRLMAVIDEAWCIGCTLCIPACPVDAVLGASKRMHTVLEAHCTGCELCVPACPVDCIHMEPVDPGLTGWAAWSRPQAQAARLRYHQTQERRARSRQEQDARRERRAQRKLEDLALHSTLTEPKALARKRELVEAALARARARRAGPA